MRTASMSALASVTTATHRHDFARRFARERDSRCTQRTCSRPRLRRTARQPSRQTSAVLRLWPLEAAPVRRGRRSGGYDAIVTGHNLDDEAAVLMGNALHWHTDYLGRQAPLLPARHGFPKKAKPLVRLTERETAAYCVLAGSITSSTNVRWRPATNISPTRRR